MQDPEDLRQMLKCMVANGYLTDEIGVKVVLMQGIIHRGHYEGTLCRIQRICARC